MVQQFTLRSRLMRNAVILSAVLLIVASGCKKDASNPVDPEPVQVSPVLSASLRNPIKNTTDPNAVKTAGQIDLVNNLLKAPWAAPFATLAGTTVGNVTTWLYYAGTVRETFTLTKSGDGSSTWTLVFFGTIGNTTYNNWVCATGTNGTNGKSGTWTKYFDNPPSVVQEDVVSFTVDSLGTITAVDRHDMQTPSGNSVTVVSKADGSGSAEIRQMLVIPLLTVTYRSEWDAAGNGTWTTYNSKGVALALGSWAK
jgi:hypothetical protein